MLPCIIQSVRLSGFVGTTYSGNDHEILNVQRTEFLFFILMARQPLWANASSLSKICDHTQTPPHSVESSGRVNGLSQRPIPENTRHSQQTFMPSAGFETAFPASELPHTHALNRGADGIGKEYLGL